jgi:S1-C subfamily serine protease
VPVLDFFTGLHDDYHKPSDDADKINVPAAAAIASLAGEVVTRLANLPERPAFVKVEGGPAPQVADAHAAGPAAPAAGPVPYRVVFGTSPDMTYQNDDGVRVSSVRPGTPAEKCGLQAGDIITGFDGKPIKTLEDYAALLFAHKPGDTVAVSVRRGTDNISLSAVLAGQAGEN